MSSSPKTLLEFWRTTTTSIDCDTLDVDLASELGPFVDCTSNQAIAALELQKPHHHDLLLEAIRLARSHHAKGHWSDLPIEKLAGEIATVLLAHRILPHLTNRVHLQTDPTVAYSTSQTLNSALRLVSLFLAHSPIQPASPSLAIDRLCLKIPSTHAGLVAAQTLHTNHQLTTLATALFSLPQAALAAQVGCAYIAPYINSLQLHFEPGFAGSPTAEHEKVTALLELQRILAYYDSLGIRGNPIVMPASLGSLNECNTLIQMGVEHLTISPNLLNLAKSLKNLNQIKKNQLKKQINLNQSFNHQNQNLNQNLNYLNQKENFENSFKNLNQGREKEKLDQSINFFIKFQLDLENKLINLLKL